MTTPTASTANGPFARNERERLILDHMPQVKLIARKIAHRLGPHFDYDDLVSIGVVGLIAAIDNFDPSQNVKLKPTQSTKSKARFWTACAQPTVRPAGSVSGRKSSRPRCACSSA